MVKIVSFFFLMMVSGLGGDSELSVVNGHHILVSDTLKTATPAELVHEFKYQLNRPDETFNLGKTLQEISGLGISDSEEFLYAVQDENGIVFKLSAKDGSILEQVTFHKDGDYEGIETVGDKVYVIKSTGTIYEISNLGTKEQQMKKFNSFLGKENDVEGLAFDKKNNRLLVACKGIPTTGEPFEVVRYKKVIYAFDLATKTLHPEPVYTIQLGSVCEFLQAHQGLKAYDKLIKFFSAEKENLTFNPSAIAIHPHTGDVYVTSSSGKVLIVLNSSGKVIHIEKLEKLIHAQPEGLVFDQKGNLYISNEGKKGTPKIHRFDYN